MEMKKMYKESVLSLIRVCTQRDKDRGYVLESANKEKLSGKQALQEMISHELNASTGRGVFYSFTFDIKLAKEYKLRNPDNTEICYIQIDLANLSTEIRGIYPIYSRDYMMSLICSTPEVLHEKKIQNPATGRYHSILGILNSSQRTVSGWANSMREIVVQCDHLKLEVVDENSFVQQDEAVVNRIISRFLFPKVSEKNVKKLREIIECEYKSSGCKRRYLLDRVNGNEWIKDAS